MKKILALGFPLVALFSASVAYAQQAFVQLADTSQSPMLSQVYQSGDLAGWVNAIFRVSLSVGAILAVLRIMYAGYLYMSSEAFGQKTHAREVIGDAVLGLLLLLSIYLILYQINPDIVSLRFLDRIKPINSGGSMQSASQQTQSPAETPQGPGIYTGTPGLGGNDQFGLPL